MEKRVLKKGVVYAGYVTGILLVVGLIYVIEISISKNIFKPEDDDYDYVSKTIVEEETPVVNVEKVIKRPYMNEEIKIIKGYYDYLADNAKQEISIIYHADTYYQNSGVDYGGVEKFDIISILDGTVIDVKEDNLLGKIVEIKHSNDMISVYQSLSEVMVKKDDPVIQGQIIGKSGNSNFSKDLGDHLHFEFIYKGQAVNPEEYYEKGLGDL
ncbi:MAG: M23 family metallopeptidase [Bacilli bacterium]